MLLLKVFWEDLKTATEKKCVNVSSHWRILGVCVCCDPLWRRNLIMVVEFKKRIQMQFSNRINLDPWDCKEWDILSYLLSMWRKGAQGYYTFAPCFPSMFRYSITHHLPWLNARQTNDTLIRKKYKHLINLALELTKISTAYLIYML